MRFFTWLALAFILWVASSAFAYAGEPLHQRIDELIAATAGDAQAPLSSDAEFVRRIFLDLSGRIPTIDETTSFLQETNTEKRRELIDRLLAGPEYPRRMQELFHVMLMERRGENEHWIKFLRSSFAANRPWDEIVRAILIPDTENRTNSGAAFFFTQRLVKEGAMAPVDVPAVTRDVGRLFAGIDLQCAQCHDHITISDYRQRDFQGLHMVFENVSTRRDLDFPAVSEKLLSEKKEFLSVFTLEAMQTDLVVPGAGEIPIPELVKGEEYRVPPDRKTRTPGIPKFSPLRELGEALTRAENDLFCKNIANRLWFVMMGRGLVEPLDLQHSENPSSHPELLDLLASEFAVHRFDIKWLVRELALTKTYQRTSVLPEGNKETAEPRTFALANEKRLSAEQLFWSVLTATGELDRQPESPKQEENADPNSPVLAPVPEENLTAAERLVSQSDELKGLQRKFVEAFANAPKVPEVEFSPSVKSALFLLHDDAVLSLFERRPGNLTDRLSELTDSQVASEMFLSVLSRNPTAEEQAHVIEYLRKNASRRDMALGQLAWAMVASTEFCLNH